MPRLVRSTPLLSVAVACLATIAFAADSLSLSWVSAPGLYGVVRAGDAAPDAGTIRAIIPLEEDCNCLPIGYRYRFERWFSLSPDDTISIFLYLIDVVDAVRIRVDFPCGPIPVGRFVWSATIAQSVVGNPDIRVPIMIIADQLYDDLVGSPPHRIQSLENDGEDESQTLLAEMGNHHPELESDLHPPYCYETLSKPPLRPDSVVPESNTDSFVVCPKEEEIEATHHDMTPSLSRSRTMSCPQLHMDCSRTGNHRSDGDDSIPVSGGSVPSTDPIDAHMDNEPDCDSMKSSDPLSNEDTTIIATAEPNPIDSLITPEAVEEVICDPVSSSTIAFVEIEQVDELFSNIVHLIQGSCSNDIASLVTIAMRNVNLVRVRSKRPMKRPAVLELLVNELRDLLVGDVADQLRRLDQYDLRALPSAATARALTDLESAVEAALATRLSALQSVSLSSGSGPKTSSWSRASFESAIRKASARVHSWTASRFASLRTRGCATVPADAVRADPDSLSPLFSQPLGHGQPSEEAPRECGPGPGPAPPAATRSAPNDVAIDRCTPASTAGVMASDAANGDAVSETQPVATVCDTARNSVDQLTQGLVSVPPSAPVITPPTTPTTLATTTATTTATTPTTPATTTATTAAITPPTTLTTTATTIATTTATTAATAVVAMDPLLSAEIGEESHDAIRGEFPTDSLEGIHVVDTLSDPDTDPVQHRTVASDHGQEESFVNATSPSDVVDRSREPRSDAQPGTKRRQRPRRGSRTTRPSPASASAVESTARPDTAAVSLTSPMPFKEQLMDLVFTTLPDDALCLKTSLAYLPTAWTPDADDAADFRLAIPKIVTNLLQLTIRAATDEWDHRLEMVAAVRPIFADLMMGDAGSAAHQFTAQLLAAAVLALRATFLRHILLRVPDLFVTQALRQLQPHASHSDVLALVLHFVGAVIEEVRGRGRPYLCDAVYRLAKRMPNSKALQAEVLAQVQERIRAEDQRQLITELNGAATSAPTRIPTTPKDALSPLPLSLLTSVEMSLLSEVVNINQRAIAKCSQLLGMKMTKDVAKAFKAVVVSAARQSSDAAAALQHVLYERTLSFRDTLTWIMDDFVDSSTKAIIAPLSVYLQLGVAQWRANGDAVDPSAVVDRALITAHLIRDEYRNSIRQLCALFAERLFPMQMIRQCLTNGSSEAGLSLDQVQMAIKAMRDQYAKDVADLHCRRDGLRTFSMSLMVVVLTSLPFSWFGLLGSRYPQYLDETLVQVPSFA